MLKKVIDRFKFWFNAARGYSTPIALMSWIVPFVFALSQGGSAMYGLLALVGIVCAHLGVNLFDDCIDYVLEEKAIEKGLKSDFEFQKGKCLYILNGGATLKQSFFVTFLYFLIALLIGIFFIINCGVVVFYIMLFTAFLCLLYPILTYVCLGEIIVGLLFAPVLYTGVYYVMTKSFTPEIFIVSVSTGLLTIGLLHTHTFMDFDFDKKNNKKTLCALVKTKENSVLVQGIIMFLAYLNILIFIISGYLPKVMIIAFLGIPTAVSLYRLLLLHINNPEVVVKRTFVMGPMENWKEIQKNNLESFMIKFLLARNVMVIFTFLLCLAIIISNYLD